MRRFTTIALRALAVLPLAANAGKTFNYKVTSIEINDLGTLGGAESRAFGINDGGDVVGQAEDVAGKKKAFIHADGVMLSLHNGTPTFEWAGAIDINNSRRVVGYFYEGNSKTRPFRYYPGIWAEKMPHLMDPSGFDWRMSPTAVNESGEVVGWAAIIPNPNLPPYPNSTNLCHEFLPVKWADAFANPARLFCIADPDGNDTWVEQGTQPGAEDINNQGHIVGTDAGTSLHSMFIFKEGIRIAVPRPAGLALQDPSGQTLHSKAAAINDLDWVAGTYGYRTVGGIMVPSKRAFIWGGVSAYAENIGTLPDDATSEAFDLNEQKMVVGESTRVDNYDRAFLWHADFGMKPLPPLWGHAVGPPGTNDCRATAVNERRVRSGLVQVAGHCLRSDGRYHAVRWDVIVIKEPIAPPFP
jgi:probable HAF family extracellular repeat protein